MHLKRLELNGFKSFAHKSEFVFDVPIIAIVGPNGSGKSNVVEAIRFVLGEQSVKSMRGKTGSDMIFKGSREISSMSRAAVSIIFDNSDRVFQLHQGENGKLDVDFDEITISREVYSDGSNKYLINGSEVRMKDIHELIASINIGSSGHHIISQGEADRYLNANVKDRRILIEEALGLKVYQYRIKESERKLEKALANMRESELLRRELAPHLKFLKKQVEKIEKAKHLQSELYKKYQDYFAQEDYFIDGQKRKLSKEQEEIQTAESTIESFLNSYPNPDQERSYPEEVAIKDLQDQRTVLTESILSVRQALGRIEGMRSLLEKQSQVQTAPTSPQGFSYDRVQNFLGSFKQKLKKILSLNQDDLLYMVQTLEEEIDEFIKVPEPITSVSPDHDQELATLSREQNEQQQKLENLESQKQEIDKTIIEKQNELEQAQIQARESERTYYEFLAQQKELQRRKEMYQEHVEALNSRLQSRTEEYTEAKVLLGSEDIEYQAIGIEHNHDITAQSIEHFRRELERIKIRLEDMGGGSGIEIIKEYQETQERDTFLEKEIHDISTSIESLQSIIANLNETLNAQFVVGIDKINIQFNKFFKLMFGGGKAELVTAVIKKRKKKTEDDDQLSLELEDEEGEDEFGIDIKVELPRKKVSDLDMLSGGERSLTSIALLFALSQVNPPPFLVLDETDAALDEANSQKYGDMIESLSEYSQLIVVTHNRETMSRAQTLFGVTLGRGDASTTLSLRLEDAAKYAK